MRLINIETMQLEEFLGAIVPEYAILSHKCREGEVLFHDMARAGVQKKEGYG